MFIPYPLPAMAGKTVVSVACGDTHTLVATDTGELWSFGRNQNGQLGLGSIQDSLSPQLVAALQVRAAAWPGAGPGAGMNGRIWPWCAACTWLQRGGSVAFHPPPLAASCARRRGRQAAHPWRQQPAYAAAATVRRPAWLQGKRVMRVACGAEHSCCVTDAGEVYCWGWGRYGNIGDGESQDRHLPTRAKGLEGVRVQQVACGWRHR